MNEIERKFLVAGDFKKDVKKIVKIKQGYLSRVAERTVRVRIADEKAFLTIKGKSSDDGTTRFEFETEIKKTDAENLLKICEDGIIEKTRHIAVYKNQKFEIDVFEGKNAGLTVAEIELDMADTEIIKPAWLGQEVTGNLNYYNSNL